MIRAGKVYVNEVIVDKPGTLVPNEATLRYNWGNKYVSRGGLKLEGALNAFKIDPTGMACVDVGASSGGFTDCLLQHGACHVYAVDVAYGQLAWSLRNDPRVTVLERCNIRTFASQQIPAELDLAVFDTSFVSLTKVIPPVLCRFKSSIAIVALIKPQFELPKTLVEPGGLVNSKMNRWRAVEKIQDFALSQKMLVHGVIPATIKGAKGNQEYLIYLTK